MDADSLCHQEMDKHIGGCETVKQLQLLTVNCQTTDDTHRKWQIHEQIKQDKFKTKNAKKYPLY